MSKCKGIIGNIFGHNFKIAYEEVKESNEQIIQSNIELIIKATHIGDVRDRLIAKELDKTINKVPILIYCARCGIEKPFDEFV